MAPKKFTTKPSGQTAAGAAELLHNLLALQVLLVQLL